MISVVLSSHNGSKYLSQALESLSQQTFKNFEVILLDDASGDQTTEIMQHYVSNDPRFKLFRNRTKLGLAASLNKGISKASFDIIARFDDDDICLPERFATQLKAIEEDEVDIVGCNAKLMDQYGSIVGRTHLPKEQADIRRKMPYFTPLVHPSVMMRRRVFSVIGGYREDLPRSQDYELWIRAMEAGFKFENLEECYLLYRIKDKPSLHSVWNGFKLGVSLSLKKRNMKAIVFRLLELFSVSLACLGVYKPRSMRHNNSLFIRK